MGGIRKKEARESASNDAIFDARDNPMRTTVTLDDALLTEASSYTNIREKSALLREALKALIQRESARRLASLGGSQPGIKPIPRRRSEA